MARASTVLSAIHVRLIHASVWLHRNRRDVGPSVAFERQRRIASACTGSGPTWAGVPQATDSPVEGRVRSEPVSEIGLFRAILDGNKLVLAPKIAKNRKPWLVIVRRVTA